ncbi:Phosphotransferase enzyme family protein [Polystyrenella longa]|uniref:Phosphotransferase enzyme family protein n=2 Tax=Polystyrenella longa TaxID=2528007 RepID=A0A518CT97_9PLAN|nr:Phosphotransferase enzyme family protein [Polystyrenella longa]
MMETHISWILLTGEFVYKFKKPVDLGFVDFTSLEKRKFYCEEELRLNSRFTEGLYLEVVCFTGPVEAPLINGPGDPLDYAVKMSQFPQESLLSHLVEQGKLQPEHIDRLAKTVANFHQQVNVADEKSPFGNLARIKEPVDENFRQLFSSMNNEAESKSRLEKLHSWSKKEHARLTSRFLKRKQDGFVRECHGDMHLGNMILWNGKVTLFDCIEFNESFRWIDVLSEVAFCVMDLMYRGHSELGHRFLNQYLEWTGDYSGMDLFPYYLAYRAMVRAKVAGIRGQQPGLTESERLKVRQESLGYLQLAEQFASKTQPVLMITHGFSGSGKTYGSQKLVDGLGAIRIRSDVERKRLHGLEQHESSQSAPGSDLYSTKATDRTYRVLEELAQILIEAGKGVIVDATFLKFDRRDQFRQLARQLQVPFRILDFAAPDNILKDRIMQRNATQQDASEADLEVLQLQRQAAEPLRLQEISEVIRLGDSDTFSAAISSITQLVENDS